MTLIIKYYCNYLSYIYLTVFSVIKFIIKMSSTKKILKKKINFTPS